MNKPACSGLRIAISTAALLLAGTSLANAGAFGLREQSAYGQGSSFAGVAAGGSLSSAYWNPATLNEVIGLELEQVVTFIIPISEVTVTGVGDQGDVGRDGFVPSGYAAYRWNDKIVLGVAINGPYGLRTKYPMTSPLRGGVAGTSEVFSINVNPMVSYDVNEWLSVGIGAQVQYLDVRLTSVGAAGVTLQGDDIGIGLTAGVVIKPMEGTEIGLGYRSYVDHDLEGSLTGVGSVTVPGVKTPDLVSLGIRHRINDAWTGMATVEWANWSRIGTFPINAGGVTVGTLPFDYNDGWFASVGAEYAWNDQLTLRGGVGWEWSPMDDGNRSFRLPDDDRLWLSIGSSYEANDRMSFDLGYSFLTTFDTDLLPAAGGGPVTNGPFGGSADANIHILSAGFKYKLGG
jgi:long-chain fatty acid transport protein